MEECGSHKRGVYGEGRGVHEGKRFLILMMDDHNANKKQEHDLGNAYA